MATSLRIGKNAGAHANVVSKRSYRGLNPILLDLASQTHSFSSKWWGTFQQWKSLGGRVMPRPDHIPPGKWGTQIVFWSPVNKKVQNENGDLEDDRFFVLRLYTVFNVDQVSGLDHLKAGQPDTEGDQALKTAFDRGRWPVGKRMSLGTTPRVQRGGRIELAVSSTPRR